APVPAPAPTSPALVPTTAPTSPAPVPTTAPATPSSTNASSPKAATPVAALDRNARRLRVDLDARNAGRRVALRALVGQRGAQKWVALGTRKLDARGNATLSLKRAKLAQLRKGTAVRVVWGRSAIASIRLR
ncbi:hypothetical protein, partial [Motilibacter deserti]